jgi:hypothetical protein
MVNPKTGRVVSQDDWKRTQVRMPQALYEDVAEYASNNDMSLNHSMIFLMDMGLYRAKPKTKKIIFTEWNPVSRYDEHSPDNNEAVRMDCAALMTKFFNDHPDHEFMQLESKTTVNKKGQEIVVGIRVWYSYTA